MPFWIINYFRDPKRLFEKHFLFVRFFLFFEAINLRQTRYPLVFLLFNHMDFNSKTVFFKQALSVEHPNLINYIALL